MKLRWGFCLGLLAVALAATGCEVCSDRDSNGDCRELDVNWDSGAGLDARTDSGPASSDGSVTSDAAKADAAAVVDGGTMDAAVVDAGPTTLAKAAFCDAQYRTAKQWSALLESASCTCDSTDDRTAVAEFLEFALLFKGIATCSEGIDRLNAKTTYDERNAASCAARLDAQFAAAPPPASCPTTGFDIASLESMIGHGAQFPAQIPECRATFVGTVARDAACNDSLECVNGLRCLPVTGGAKSCQPARQTNEACATNADCADNHVCAGTSPPGRTCIGISQLELKPQGSNCSASFECINGLVCAGTSGMCLQPQPDVICKP